MIAEPQKAAGIKNPVATCGTTPEILLLSKKHFDPGFNQTKIYGRLLTVNHSTVAL